jgi:hypothetical protein
LSLQDSRDQVRDMCAPPKFCPVSDHSTRQTNARWRCTLATMWRPILQASAMVETPRKRLQAQTADGIPVTFELAIADEQLQDRMARWHEAWSSISGNPGRLSWRPRPFRWSERHAAVPADGLAFRRRSLPVLCLPLPSAGLSIQLMRRIRA